MIEGKWVRTALKDSSAMDRVGGVGNVHGAIGSAKGDDGSDAHERSNRISNLTPQESGKCL